MSRRREREKRDEKELRGEEGGVRRGTSQEDNSMYETLSSIN